MTSAKEGAVFESILPQQKKGDDVNTRLDHSPQQKRRRGTSGEGT